MTFQNIWVLRPSFFWPLPLLTTRGTKFSIWKILLKNWFNVDKRRLEVRGPRFGQAIPVDIHYSLCSGYLWYCTTGKIRTWTEKTHHIKDVTRTTMYNLMMLGQCTTSMISTNCQVVGWFCTIYSFYFGINVSNVSDHIATAGNRSRDSSLFQVLWISLGCCPHPG